MKNPISGSRVIRICGVSFSPDAPLQHEVIYPYPIGSNDIRKVFATAMQFALAGPVADAKEVSWLASPMQPSNISDWRDYLAPGSDDIGVVAWEASCAMGGCEISPKTIEVWPLNGCTSPECSQAAEFVVKALSEGYPDATVSARTCFECACGGYGRVPSFEDDGLGSQPCPDCCGGETGPSEVPHV